MHGQKSIKNKRVAQSQGHDVSTKKYCNFSVILEVSCPSCAYFGYAMRYNAVV